MNKYDVVIGLEIHAELSTKSKAFCSCRNEFGALPNTQVCPVCLGLPGSLPMLNRKAVEYTIMGGLSFGSDINSEAVFERKNYFYPDLSKSYQVTQLSQPLCSGGGIALSSGKYIKFNRIHLEEDTAKLIHDDESNKTLVDFNRSGVPLIEMVTDPQIMTSSDVVEFLTKLRQTLIYSGVAKCKMEEGGIRFDLNISVSKKVDSSLGTRCEINNLSSLKSVENAIEFESHRQIEILESNGEIIRETRVWNDETQESYSVRKKEFEKDYRYFPDPDIIPVEITDKDIDRLKSRLPEIIDSRKNKLLGMGISHSDVDILLKDRELLEYYHEVVEINNNPIETMNWLKQDILHEIKSYANISLKDIITPKNLAKIINQVVSENITRTNAKVLLDEVIKTGKDADKLVKQLDLAGEVNKKDIVDLVGMLINDNPEIIKDYGENPQTVMNFFIGNIIKNTQGKAKAEYVEPLIVEILKKYNQE